MLIQVIVSNVLEEHTLTSWMQVLALPVLRDRLLYMKEQMKPVCALVRKPLIFDCLFTSFRSEANITIIITFCQHFVTQIHLVLLGKDII